MQINIIKKNVIVLTVSSFVLMSNYCFPVFAVEGEEAEEHLSNFFKKVEVNKQEREEEAREEKEFLEAKVNLNDFSNKIKLEIEKCEKEKKEEEELKEFLEKEEECENVLKQYTKVIEKYEIAEKVLKDLEEKMIDFKEGRVTVSEVKTAKDIAQKAEELVNLEGNRVKYKSSGNYGREYGLNFVLGAKLNFEIGKILINVGRSLEAKINEAKLIVD